VTETKSQAILDARTTTDEDASALARQFAACERKANADGFGVAARIADEALSGIHEREMQYRPSSGAKTTKARK